MAPIQAEQLTEREQFERDRALQQQSCPINWPMSVVSVVVLGLLALIAVAALFQFFG